MNKPLLYSESCLCLIMMKLPEENSKIIGNMVTALEVDKNNTWWIATSKALNAFGNNSISSHYILINSLDEILERSRQVLELIYKCLLYQLYFFDI